MQGGVQGETDRKTPCCVDGLWYDAVHKSTQSTRTRSRQGRGALLTNLCRGFDRPKLLPEGRTRCVLVELSEPWSQDGVCGAKSAASLQTA